MRFSICVLHQLGRWAGWKMAGMVAVVLWHLAAGSAAAGGITADRFASNGDLISGWYWLRDAQGSQYAEYTWLNPPRTGDITLEFTVLATDRVNGGPGVNAHFDLLVGFPGAGNMGGVFKQIGLTLQNTGDSGPGYTNHRYFTLQREVIDDVMPANGMLFLRVVRGTRDPHVAFNAASIKIVSDEDIRDDTLGELLLDQLQGGGTTLDHDTLQDLLDLLENRDGLDEQTLRELLEQLLKGGGDIVIDQRGGGTLDERTLRELLEQLLRERDGTLPDGRLGDDTTTDLHPDEGDWGDEGKCFLDRPCLGQVADGFRSTGYPGAGGWFWLRTPVQGQTAEYLFETPPAGGDLILDIAVLGQNQIGMRPKDTVHVNLTIGYPGSGSLGGQIGPFTVELPGLWIGPDEDVWKARALVRLSREDADTVIARPGGLFLRFEQVDGFEPEVGFSAASVLLYPAQDLSR
jgi:hypothetical protein